MPEVTGVRRVVLGTDGDDRSLVTHDAHASVVHGGPVSGYAVSEIWATTALPPPAKGADPTLTSSGLSTDLPRGHTKFWIVDFPPGNGGIPPFMHRTPTLDYLVVLSGSITLELDEGEVELHAGDTAVQRGNRHAWRNDGAEPCRVAVVMVSLT